MNTTHRVAIAATILGSLASSAGCQSSEGAGNTPQPGVGPTAGGTTLGSFGGAEANAGGSTSSGVTGGAAGNGGAITIGGSAGAGGAPASGGVATGGSTSTGGVATGGATSTGGATTSGGAVTGGTASKGGATGSGGASSGGTTASAGAPAVTGVITVAKDGSGDVTTIQAGIDRVPDGNTSWKIVLVKNGVYAEHVLIDKSYVALVGESRQSVRIELALDRSVWNADMGVTNTGSGVVDLGVDSVMPTKKVTVTNVLIGNLSVINTVDTSTATGTVYTHAIRGETSANYIWVIHSDVLATGSDTLALWNDTAGMYYHASCKFQGGIDAVCPRGWAYDADSTYIETKSSAPLWHAGVTGSTQKFVIRNAYVQPDVARNIKLLNGQDQSTLYLLDSYFYNSGGKTIAQGTVSAAYYSNCHMEGGDQTWHADNLASAPGSPSPAQVTASWTFDGKWDPEASFPAVLPFAAIPYPFNKAQGVPTSVQLTWARARDAQSYEIYVDTVNPPTTLAGQAATNRHSPTSLKAGTTYYWRVDAVLPSGKVPGAVWSFTVGA